MLVPPPFGLSLSPKELGVESLGVKGIICFLTLLAVSMWLLAHTGKLEGVMEKLVLLLMFLVFAFLIFFFVRRKDIRQLFSPTIFRVICYCLNCQIGHLLLKRRSRILCYFAFLPSLLI